MGWIDTLRGSVVSLDTAPLIYFTEGDPTYLSVVNPFFQAIQQGEFKVITSIMTLLEVLVYPIKRGDAKLAQQYRDILFYTRGLTTAGLTPDIAEEAAGRREVRRRFRSRAAQAGNSQPGLGFGQPGTERRRPCP